MAIEHRRLGRTDMHVSVLGFGGAEIGYGRAAQETVDALLGAALDAGLNVIDTAECYKDSEILIGNAVAHRRKDFHLFTKVGHASASGLPGHDWDPAMMERSIDRSLQRLRVNHVDLIQLHSCDEAALRKGDVIDVLRRARDAGKTRYIGYSGDNEAAHFAVECGAFDTLQTSVSIADQDAIERTLPLAAARGVGVIAKRPVANAAWRYGDTRPAESYHVPYWERLRELKYDFLRGDPEQAMATALRFTLSEPAVATAIVGTTKPGRWKQNAALLAAGPLPPDDIERIRARWNHVSKQWPGQI